MNKRNFLIITGIISLYFLWGGSAYISQMYHLMDYLAPEQVDMIAMRWNYTAQISGILIYAYLLWRFRNIFTKRIIYKISLILSAVSLVFMLTSTYAPVIIVSGLILNLFLGSLACHNLTMLASFVNQNHRGKSFGFAYAIGSIGTYVISLISGGKLLSSKYVVFVYLAAIAVNFILVNCTTDLPVIDKNTNTARNLPSYLKRKSDAALLFTMFFLMSLLISIGSNYQMSALIRANVTLESTRLFYAVGLIAAGIIADTNRKFIAVFSIASVVYAFVSVVLYGYPSVVYAAWALSYLFLAFYSVYRAVAFVDIAGKNIYLLPLAGLGLCIGRIGEAASTFMSDELLGSPIFSTILLAALFIPLIFMFVSVYHKLYAMDLKAKGSSEDIEEMYLEFAETHSLSKREYQVLRQLINGLSNCEISGALYIAESTVKFHIKNILRKTSCTNRTEVIKLMMSSKKV